MTTPRALIAIAVAALVLLAGCGGSQHAGPARPAAHVTAYDSHLMTTTERDIRAAIRKAVAKRGYNVVSTQTDCIADTARRFTCDSTSRVRTAGATCTVFLSEQRGVVDAHGKGYWKSAMKGTDGTVPCDS